MPHPPVQTPSAVDHVAAFFSTDHYIVERIAAFVGDGLRAGEHILVMTTNAHWSAVAQRLDAEGFAHGAAAARGQLVVADAEVILEQVTENGRVDVRSFRDLVGKLVQGQLPQRIYGEIVNLLAARGNVDAAIEIEQVGHTLSHEHGIRVLCGYHAGAAVTGPERARIGAVHDRTISQHALERPFHAVQFYEDAGSLTRLIAGFLGEGLALTSAAIAIATAPHRAGLVDHLRRQGFDVEQLQATDRLILLDAHTLLDAFMIDGMPDARRFRRAMVPVLERASRGRKRASIRAYGEMVDVLWKAGSTVAATRLEMLWNDLAQTHEFSLLCGYAMGNFYKAASHQEICSLHTHVVTDAAPLNVPGN